MKKWFFVWLISGIAISGNAQCYYSLPTTFWTQSKTTSIPELDNIINTENTILSAVFGVIVDPYIGYENANEENAMFAPGCDYPNCQGRIYLGVGLMKQLFTKKFGIERLKSTFAHEYAHALQNKYGWGGFGKYPELHADFLAGYYIGVKGAVSNELLKSFVTEFYSMGDNNFFSPGHHGTGTERGCAFIEGYKIATENHYNIYQAYLAGLEYVRLNTPCISFIPQKRYEEAEQPVVQKAESNSTATITNASKNKRYRFYNSNHQFIAELGPNESYTFKNVPTGVYTLHTNKYSKLLGWSLTADVIFEMKESTELIYKVSGLHYRKYDYDIWTRAIPKPRNYAKEAMVEYESKRYNLAIPLFDQEIIAHPNNYNAYFFRAMCKAQIGDRKGSINDNLQILKNENEIIRPMFVFASVYNNIGYDYLKLNDIPNAEKFIAKAMETNQYESYIWGSRGELNFVKGKYDLCIKDMTESIRLVEGKLSKGKTLAGDGFAYYYRGLAYLKLKKNKTGCADLAKSKELGYSNAEAELLKQCK